MKIGNALADELGVYLDNEISNREFTVTVGDAEWTVESAVFRVGELEVSLRNGNQTRNVSIKLVVTDDRPGR